MQMDTHKYVFRFKGSQELAQSFCLSKSFIKYFLLYLSLSIHYCMINNTLLLVLSYLSLTTFLYKILDFSYFTIETSAVI